MDRYGTQRVISFIRQMVEHGGFYRTSDRVWIRLERVQFVGACNPPTDPGRKPLTHRYACFHWRKWRNEQMNTELKALLSVFNKRRTSRVFSRFLRHVPVIYVDHPGPASLKQIYGTFNRAMLRMVPSLRPFADPLTNAMVEFYTMSQERFTQVRSLVFFAVVNRRNLFP